MELLKKPSAWVPILMSLAALSLVLGYVAIVGNTEPQEDEGAAARIFQLLLAGQLPIVTLFAFRWLPRAPRRALLVLGLQIAAALAAFVFVFILEL